jgi:hypothetical protein
MRKWLPWVIAVALLGAALFAIAPGAQAKWAHCDSFGCVNKKLNALHKKQQKLQKKQQELQYEVFQCEQLAPITSYYGYWYGDSGDLTTALDYTVLGDSPEAWMVVDTCGTAKRKLAALPTDIQRKH